MFNCTDLDNICPDLRSGIWVQLHCEIPRPLYVKSVFNIYILYFRSVFNIYILYFRSVFIFTYLNIFPKYPWKDKNIFESEKYFHLEIGHNGIRYTKIEIYTNYENVILKQQNAQKTSLLKMFRFSKNAIGTGKFLFLAIICRWIFFTTVNLHFLSPYRYGTFFTYDISSENKSVLLFVCVTYILEPENVV